MNGLIPSLGEKEKMQIADELTRLFALQDAALGREKKAAFVDELSVSGFPMGAIVDGIRSLVSEELNTIKIGRVKGAIRSKMTVEAKEKCSKCFDGQILMKDDRNYEFALACNCPRGFQVSVTGGLATWNGEAKQYSHGRFLFQR